MYIEGFLKKKLFNITIWIKQKDQEIYKKYKKITTYINYLDCFKMII